MIERLEASWELVKASARVLRADSELLIFPLLSALGVILVTISIAAPAFSLGLFGYIQEHRDAGRIVGVGLTFLFYLATYTVIFFCNSALVAAALIRLRGGDPTVNDGLKAAWERLPEIFGYALISATVGMVLRALSERAGFLGRIVVSLIGGAWNVLTFLAVPVLVTERVGPMDAVRRSGELLKQTWGEQLAGNLGIGLAFFWGSLLLSMLAVGLCVGVASLGSPALVGAAMVFLCLWFCMLALLHAALRGVYTAAVYHYATAGQLPSQFDPEHIRQAFRPKAP